MNNNFSAWLLPVLFFLSLTASAQEFGYASYYSDRYQGRRTAYGDVYDRNKLTCSHKKHPYGTLLRITRIDNKKSVICKVIDKGPYTKGRIVDVSLAAANEIGLVQDGVVEVKVEVYKPNQTQQETASSVPVPTISVETSAPDRKTQEKPRQAEPAPAAAGQPERLAEEKAAPAEPATTKDNWGGKPVGQEYAKYGLYKIRVEKGPATGFAVQVMVVSDYENAVRAVASYQGRGFDNILVSIEHGSQPAQTLYKILLGPFDTENQADGYQSSLKRRYKISGFVVNLAEKDYSAIPAAAGAGPIKP